jgi:ABC-type molybdenum transport system ATPase subunit/photorepair protein PhrA
MGLTRQTVAARRLKREAKKPQWRLLRRELQRRLPRIFESVTSAASVIVNLAMYLALVVTPWMVFYVLEMLASVLSAKSENAPFSAVLKASQQRALVKRSIIAQPRG